ncbi:DNA topoisomerase 3 [Geothrix sp. PMB-07]|uniref:DNA topoisomerase 3 n=1 Tax=Geothrix sp. PMB-07 TaxID=3068640 RepID=UPI0027428276|nr:DNA topoisomerase 3 [Geothrix sp. PMB-07]WLT30063.1 DNA topoisomerase 3 [Geothrix sp. PMB-07]
MGRAVAEALGLPGRGRSLIEGNGLVVTWCVGHLVEALNPEGYDPAWKAWRWDRLPIFPEPFRYVAIPQTRDQFDVVARLLNREDITEVVNATDAGREGELIFDLVYRLADCTKPVLRFWTSSLTPEAIQEAYQAMKPGEAYTGLREAARSRQEADWLVGINATRAQTLRMRRAGAEEGVWSVGRVQTPTLALLVRRELEIRDFKPQPFWTLRARFAHPNGTYEGRWFKETEGQTQERFATEEEARGLAAKLEGKPGRIRSATGRTEKKKPELLYDLTALQKEANKRFNLTAEETLGLAQNLYEKQLISYPRTNSRHLTEADAQKAPQWIKSLAQGQLTELGPFLDELRKRWPVKLDKRFVNDKEVEDHAALVPTEKPARGLVGDELRIYELIARRFLGAYFPDRVEAKTTIITEVEGETFKTNGTIVKEEGWSAVDPPHRRKKVGMTADQAEAEAGAKGHLPKAGPQGEAQDVPSEEEADEETEGGLPLVKKGEGVEVASLHPKEGKTTPPKRMSEGDLLSAMQGAGRDLDDEALRGAMKDCGLGTPATRANMIETLIKRAYIERKRNVLLPTDKGIRLIQSLPAEALCSAELTGNWEARLERMRRGEEAREAFMADIRGFVAGVVADLQEAPAPQIHGSPCPKCGQPMRVIPSTRRGDFFHRCSPCNLMEPVPKTS